MRLPSNKSIDCLFNINTNGSHIGNGIIHAVEDQLEQVGDTVYAYNEDGYLASKLAPEGTTHYNYGTLGELKSVVLPNITIEYLHNANNQRVAKKVNGVITEKYLWKDLTTLLAVYNVGNSLKIRFEYANGRMPYKMNYEGNTYYLGYDQVGTLKAVTSEDGTIVKSIEYDTFGNVLSDSNLTFKVPFGFAGGLYDQDTKLTRFGYRDYDAYTGKWTAKDPIGFDGGDTNLYGYVLQDPVNFMDPTGEFRNPIIVISVGTMLLLKVFDYSTGFVKTVNIYNSHAEVDAVCAEAKRSLQNLIDKVDNSCVENKTAYKQQLILEQMELNRICFELYRGAWF